MVMSFSKLSWCQAPAVEKKYTRYRVEQRGYDDRNSAGTKDTYAVVDIGLD
jgi:hypothetical protein